LATARVPSATKYTAFVDASSGAQGAEQSPASVDKAPLRAGQLEL
jgi:hypothetical protein